MSPGHALIFPQGQPTLPLAPDRAPDLAGRWKARKDGVAEPTVYWQKQSILLPAHRLLRRIHSAHNIVIAAAAARVYP